jgi:hypothetical protein
MTKNTHEDTYTKTVNATARSAGAVGARALVPRKVRELAAYDVTILDYGSGPKAMHTLGLRDDGYSNVTAHELGGNLTSVHDPDALTREYDVVMASNVLNVQPTLLDLARVVGELRCATKSGGLLVCNFPASPRKCEGTDADHVRRLLMACFELVERIGGTKQAPVFLCRN